MSMRKKTILALLFLFNGSLVINASTNIIVNLGSDNVSISPYLYGRNGAPTSDAEYTKIKEAGIRFERMNDGNNCTKYNWRKKLTCHPDWYNNVYACDWDDRAQKFQSKLPDVKGMFAFQLLGKVAKTNQYNFNDWDYNQSQWWSGCSKKLCGGGQVDADGNIIQLGDTSLFLQDWPADSTTAIYTHWSDDLNLDMNQYEYWNMDNEMEIWGGTHSDVIANVYTNDTYEEIMQKYFAVAKSIRKINPNVKLCGPAAASEWTWFTGSGNTQPTVNGKTYCWLEYFIMRCAQEEKETGIRMIDVLDIHNYPDVSSDADILQCHRILYDKNYNYPKANGVKKINGGWDNSQTKEYILERCKEWIIKYYGDDNNIKFGIGEYNVTSNASETIHALSYASMIGEGARHGMEYFTPWTWHECMWEVVHLFSKTAKEINVGATSDNEALVSAYCSKNSPGDSLTIIFVNRSSSEENINTVIHNGTFKDGQYSAYTLDAFSKESTFQSGTQNSLKKGTIMLTNNSIQTTLPAYSITSITLHDGTADLLDISDNAITLYPTPVYNDLTIKSDNRIKQVTLINETGITCTSMTYNAETVKIDLSSLAAGVYFIQVQTENNLYTSKIIKK